MQYLFILIAINTLECFKEDQRIKIRKKGYVRSNKDSYAKNGIFTQFILYLNIIS